MSCCSTKPNLLICFAERMKQNQVKSKYELFAPKFKRDGRLCGLSWAAVAVLPNPIPAPPGAQADLNPAPHPAERLTRELLRALSGTPRKLSYKLLEEDELLDHKFGRDGWFRHGRNDRRFVQDEAACDGFPAREIVYGCGFQLQRRHR